MVFPPKPTHPTGEPILATFNPLAEVVEVETCAGKVHIEWNPDAAVASVERISKRYFTPLLVPPPLIDK